MISLGLNYLRATLPRVLNLRCETDIRIFSRQRFLLDFSRATRSTPDLEFRSKRLYGKQLVRATNNVQTKNSEDKKKKEGRGVNERKRAAGKAKEWAEELTKLNIKEIEKFVSLAELDEDTLQAIKLAKSIGPRGKNGWRRQVLYLGGLLRGVDPELINLSYEAVKTGDLRKLSNWKIQNEGEDESIDNEPAQDDLEFLAEQEEEMQSSTVAVEETVADSIVSKWLEGLLSGDNEVTQEVYRVDHPEFDRQILRKLVRELSVDTDRLKAAVSNTDPTTSIIQSSVSSKEKQLVRYLQKIANIYQKDL